MGAFVTIWYFWVAFAWIAFLIGAILNVQYRDDFRMTQYLVSWTLILFLMALNLYISAKTANLNPYDTVKLFQVAWNDWMSVGFYSFLLAFFLCVLADIRKFKLLGDFPGTQIGIIFGLTALFFSVWKIYTNVLAPFVEMLLKIGGSVG